MRYCLAIDLNKKNLTSYSFGGTEISKHLKKEKHYEPESFIKLTTLIYEREKTGLIEKNWNNPIYNDQRHFIFIAGSVLYRNSQNKGDIVPTPKEILDILIEYGDNHYNILKGNYYLLYLNKIEMKIQLYSSPMFMHPAFFAYQNNRFIFSNYLESFKNYIPITLDKQGMVEFSLFDHCIHTRTIYKEIKNVAGGWLFEFKDEDKNERLCYDLTKWFTNKPKKRKYALVEINESLKLSIQNYIKNTDKFNASLTGGFDGRLNFSFIDKKDYTKLYTMSYGTSGSKQISVPKQISESLGFNYRAVLLDETFENMYSEMGTESINLTCGITGFNRAVYPYAYNIIKNYSRSCMIGQCDMIRPLYNNPAGVIFNDFSHAIFFKDYKTYKRNVMDFAEKAFITTDFFSKEILTNIYEEIQNRYIKSYPNLNDNQKFYFFLLKESLMKYWHTEFHLVDIFVDDFVSFADLDYLEVLFNSEYAGIYKGLLATNQLKRRHGQDLYIDLMTINNNRLNYFLLDRGFAPVCLKFGLPGWLFAGVAKYIAKFKNRNIFNDTFNAPKWSKIFLEKNQSQILKESAYFNTENIKTHFYKYNLDSGINYRFNRAISLKIWLNKFNPD